MTASEPRPDYAWADAVAEKLIGIREPAQRFARLLELFQNRSGEEIAQFLWRTFDQAPRQNSTYRRLHLDLLRYRKKLESLGYEKVEEIYREAMAQQWFQVATLFRTHHRAAESSESKPEGFASKLASMTLGHRKQLGRAARKRSLEILLFDNDPNVIRELLRNPRISEQQVVRIASRHQASPEILETLLESDRWMNCYSIKKALVFNPRLPVAVAASLIRHLQGPDLRLFINGGSSERTLLALAKSLLEDRRTGR